MGSAEHCKVHQIEHTQYIHLGKIHKIQPVISIYEYHWPQQGVLYSTTALWHSLYFARFDKWNLNQAVRKIATHCVLESAFHSENNDQFKQGRKALPHSTLCLYRHLYNRTNLRHTRNAIANIAFV